MPTPDHSKRDRAKPDRADQGRQERSKPDKSSIVARRRLVRRARKITIWLAVIAVVGGLFYALSQSSGVRFDEDDLTPIDFTALDAAQKRAALETANAARCTCGCGLALAECVATDATCPVREGNIERIRTIVANAAKAPRP